MIRIFSKYIKNKYFIMWICLLIIVLYLIFNPLLSDKLKYMQENNMSDITYIFYVFLLPMSFYEAGILTCLILDFSYICLMMYIVSCFINYFLIESSSSTLVRISRDEWIKNVFKCNFIFSLIITIIYIIFYFILCQINNVHIVYNLYTITIMFYKLLVAIIIPNIYLMFYIKTKGVLISLGFSFMTYFACEMIIKFTFNIDTLAFSYIYIIIIFFITLYFL